MADMRIVNFDALQNAIDQFEACSASIARISSAMADNASEFTRAIVSDASNTYAGKANGFAQSIGEAKSALDTRITELLRTDLSQARATEAAAEGIAESVRQFSME